MTSLASNARGKMAVLCREAGGSSYSVFVAPPLAF